MGRKRCHDQPINNPGTPLDGQRAHNSLHDRRPFLGHCVTVCVIVLFASLADISVRYCDRTDDDSMAVRYSVPFADREGCSMS